MIKKKSIYIYIVKPLLHALKHLFKQKIRIKNLTQSPPKKKNNSQT